LRSLLEGETLLAPYCLALQPSIRPTNTMAASLAAASPTVCLRQPARAAARGRTALRCVAAGPIPGDGRVKFANNKEEFEAVTAGAGSGLVAVQISTRTCGPCRVVYPHFAGLSEDLPNVTFVKVMGDHDTESRALMKEWGVRVVPLFKLFRDGEKVHEWSGAKPDALKENILANCTDEEKSLEVINA